MMSVMSLCFGESSHRLTHPPLHIYMYLCSNALLFPSMREASDSPATISERPTLTSAAPTARQTESFPCSVCSTTLLDMSTKEEERGKVGNPVTPEPYDVMTSSRLLSSSALFFPSTLSVESWTPIISLSLSWTLSILPLFCHGLF
jgi:hypothetical protein